MPSSRFCLVSLVMIGGAVSAAPRQAPPEVLVPAQELRIEQAMGLPKSRPARAAVALADFVERCKASGFVARSLARHGIQGASVAP